MRVGMLTRQAEMISHLNADLGREWANEVFALSLQLKESQRSQVQGTALRIVIRLDPDRALELLHQLILVRFQVETNYPRPSGNAADSFGVRS